MSAHVFDLHDEAYYVWRERGVRGAELVHVDGHHDAEAAAPSGCIGIGNYVRAAFEQGMVAHVYWVVPDQMWRDAARRALVHRVLGETPPVPITACPLAALPFIRTPVLLDVDVDYFFTIGYGRDTVGLRLAEPAGSAADLTTTLNARCPLRLATTIATSVTGCFTPFEWRHLGEETAAGLEDRAPDVGVGQAAGAYRTALRLQSEGQVAEARQFFARAVSLDPGCRHPFRTPGHVYRHIGRTEEAGQCFVAALELDPDDGWAALGLAMIDVAGGRAADALSRLPASPPDPGALDWWRTRGQALAEVGDREAAVACYTQALSLAIGGAVPLHMRTSNRDRRLVDPAHWHDHAALAALYSGAGDARLARVHDAIARAALGRQPSGVVGS